MTPPHLPALGDHDSVRVIASGGMGIVLEVRNRRTGASYAAKVILQAQDPRARDRFRREAELLARCDSHPGIVKVHSLGETAEGSLYMILDLVRGESLEALLGREGCLEARRAATLALGVANALGFVHERGIRHRDVKPSNILIDANETPRLTDFGLATARDVERLTVTGVFLGTLHYASPEQAAGKTTSPASDVFSLGGVLFHALAGTTPINATTGLELVARLADPDPLDDVRSHVPGVPGSLAAIVARALAKDPAERYANGSELARDLERFLSGEDVTFVPARRRRRQGILLLALAVVAAVVLAAVAIALVLVRGARAREALAAARDELARARTASARPNATTAELALAREHVRRATGERERATRLGADRDEPLEREIATEDADLAGALAGAALARGDASAALAAIDATPGAPDALPETCRTLRARVLIALGRPAEALHAIEGRKDALTLEVAGDAHMALEHPGEARLVYDRALAVAPRASERTLRAKRGGAAALAGDLPAARADLVALLGDPPALPQDAASIAPIASIAPALYCRGLAAGATSDGARDLETAWRLGPPPATLLGPVMKAWTAEAESSAAAWNTERIALLKISDLDVDRLAAILAVAQRVRRIDPGASLPEVTESLQIFRNGMTPRIGEKGVGVTARRLLAVYPDDPNLLFLIGAFAEGGSEEALREGVDADYRAVDHLSETSGGHDHRFPTNLMTGLCQLLEHNPGLPVDAARLMHGGELAETSSAWESIGTVFAVRRSYELALDCFERGSRCRNPEGNWPDPGNFVTRRADILLRMGNVEAAIELARVFHEASPTNSSGTFALMNAYARAGDWDAILALVDTTRVTNRGIGLKVVEALSKRARPDEARALLARLRAVGKREDDTKRVEAEIGVDEAERRIDALLRGGQRDDALALARRLPDAIAAPAATALLAATLNRCGLPAEAVRAVDRLPVPVARAAVERGLALVKLGDLGGARDVVAHMKGNDQSYEARTVEAALAEAEKGRPR